MSGVVSEVLHVVEAPSVESDLLSLGLTSLMAVRASSLLSQRHDVTVSTASVLQHRTIAGIAGSLSLIHI